MSTSVQRRALLACLASALCASRSFAQSVYFGGVVGSSPGARGVSLSRESVPSALRWVSPTRAALTFRAGGARLHAEVSLGDDDLSARVRSARTLTLQTDSPFAVEARPDTALPLLAGGRVLRVALPDELPFDTARVGREIDLTEPRRSTVGGASCARTELWASPRIAGPMLVTRGEPLASAASAAHPGWYEVTLERAGVLVRGYTFSPPSCAYGGIFGSRGRGSVSSGPDRRVAVTLPAGSRVRPAAGRAWWVEVRAPTPALRQETPAGAEFTLTLDDHTTATLVGVVDERAAGALP